jgi:hypothetical protein
MTLGKVVTLAIAVLGVQASAAGAAAQPRIVGGGSAAISDFPYQAALIDNAQSSAYYGQFCGATIRDPTHVITAAHCVYDNPYTPAGQAIRPADVDVLVGTDHLSTGGQRLHVAAVSFDPGYDTWSISDDAAVVTLAAPISAPGAALLPVISGAEWAPVNIPGTSALVSGWGTTSYDGLRTDQLLSVQVPLVSDDPCNGDYAAYGGIDPPVMVCAGDTTTGQLDACQGDSGGPLALQQTGGVMPADKLIGIVSFGVGCGDPAFPGVYTEVAEPGIRAFVTDPAPVPVPRNSSRPTITGTALVGQTLTCDKGTWTGADAYDYQFGNGSQTNYTVTAADVGRQIVCYVRGRNAGGYAVVQSVATQVVQAAPATTPQPVPVAPTMPPIESPQDTTAPVAHIVSGSCVKRRCTLGLTVTDAGFSTGIKGISAKVVSTYRTTCVKRGKRVACTKKRTRTLSAARSAIATFRVIASGLPVGTNRFTVFATDNAGHRQLLPAVATLRTRRRAG